jgi:HEPN domain-containing protein
MADLNFTAAATRHLRDARLLAENGRYDNALYLAGYVVECSLKAVASGHGVQAQAYGHGLSKLEGDALDLAMAMAPAASRYRPPVGTVQEVSSRWSTSHRYALDHVTPGMASVVIESAERVWKACIGAMWLDGFILELP